MKKLLLTAMMIMVATTAFADKAQKESYYSKIWCDANGGIEEVKTSMGTRADCVLDNYAVEVDFDNKWAEGLGQALHYGVEFNKKPAVLLILKNQDGKDRRKYVDRLTSTIDGAGLDVEVFIIEARDYPTR
jgi:hypothetical protein